MEKENLGKYQPSYDDYDGGMVDSEPEDETEMLRQWEEQHAASAAAKSMGEELPPDELVIDDAPETANPPPPQAAQLQQQQLPTVHTVPKPHIPTQELVHTMLNNEFNHKAGHTKRTARKSAEDMAKSMHDERERIFGSNTVQHAPASSVDTALRLATAAQAILPAADAHVFALSAQSLGTSSTASAASSGEGGQEDARFRPFVMSDGSLRYLRYRPALVTTGALTSNPTGVTGETLLSQPMSELVREAERLQVKAVVTKMSMGESHASADEDMDRGATLGEAGASSTTKNRRDNPAEQLWVDKHAPKSFSQLLSPEKINREVLKALKRWDPFVFKKSVVGPAQRQHAYAHQRPDRSSSSSSDTRPHIRAMMLCGPPGTGKTTLAHVVARHCGYRTIEVNASDDRSPEMLRETLARATQSHSLLTTIPAGGSDSLFGSTSNTIGSPSAGKTLALSSQPNCIILDEIDGIDGRHTIDVLIAALKAPLRSSSASSSASGAQPLTRPLICICNDAYAPALRELRRHCELFVFAPPNETRLVQRLKAVCAAEKLLVHNTQYLNDLCAASGNDIRSSINSLQFAAIRAMDEGATKLQNGEAVDMDSTLASVLQGNATVKDDQCDVYQVWKKIFIYDSTLTTTSKRMAAKASTANTISAPLEYPDTNAGSGSRWQGISITNTMRAMDLMAGCGEYTLLIPGLFENVHSVTRSSAADAHMASATHVTEWFSLSDTFMGFAYTAPGGFAMLPYISVLGAAVNLFSASKDVGAAARLRIEWPKRDREVQHRRQRNENIVASMLESCAQRVGRSSIGKMRSNGEGESNWAEDHSIEDTVSGNGGGMVASSRRQTVLDLIPYLMDVLCPLVRPLMLITMTPTEQEKLMVAVRAMESYGLTYVSQHTSNLGSTSHTKGWGGNDPWNGGGGGVDGQESLQLDPALPSLLNFTASSDIGDNTALENRHFKVSPELRLIIYTEQRNFAIQSRIQRVMSKHAQHQQEHSHSTSESGSGTSPSAGTLQDGESIKESGAAKRLGSATPDPVVSPCKKRRQSSSTSSSTSSSIVPPPSLPVPVAVPAPSESQKKTFSFRKGLACQRDAAAADLAAKTDAANKLRKKADVRFKFSQGFSNAVRRVVTINEFL